MKTSLVLIKRNIKLFFRDKGMFFTSLITPAILLLLYVTFLGNVYRDSFTASLPEGVTLPESLIEGLVGAQLASSILAVSCVTVAFCSNFLMVQDRANGTIKDITISPVKPSVMSVSYYIASLASTLLICYTAAAICLVYMAIAGWYMSALDIILLLLDVLLLTLFGTALSSVINFFLSSQGQISAVGSVVSSCYGFICGAYMPISSFGDGLRTVISFLPGTYATSLVRNHAMRGALAKIGQHGVTAETVKGIKDAIDCNLYFFERSVSIYSMYIVLAVTIAALIGAYVVMNVLKGKKAGK